MPDVEIVWAELGQQLTEALKPLREALRQFSEAWPDVHSKIGRDCAFLGSQGWLAFGRLTPGEISDVAESGRQDSTALDRFFEQYFSSRRGLEFRNLERSLAMAPVLAPWGDTVRALTKAYRQQQYCLVVPAGLALLEGTIAALTRQVSQKSPKNMWRTPPRHDRSMVYITWRAVEAFIDTVFAASPFAAREPEMINRHWVLHGRTVRFFTRADALKVLSAIAVVAEYHDYTTSWTSHSDPV